MALPANYLLFHNDRDIDVKGTIPGQQPETQQKVCRETKKMHPGAAWYPQENQAVFRGGGPETSVIKREQEFFLENFGTNLVPSGTIQGSQQPHTVPGHTICHGRPGGISNRSRWWQPVTGYAIPSFPRSSVRPQPLERQKHCSHAGAREPENTELANGRRAPQPGVIEVYRYSTPYRGKVRARAGGRDMKKLLTGCPVTAYKGGAHDTGTVQGG